MLVDRAYKGFDKLQKAQLIPASVGYRLIQQGVDFWIVVMLSHYGLIRWAVEVRLYGNNLVRDWSGIGIGNCVATHFALPSLKLVLRFM